MYIFSPDEGNNAFGIYFLINSYYDSFFTTEKGTEQGLLSTEDKKTRALQTKTIDKKRSLAKSS